MKTTGTQLAPFSQHPSGNEMSAPEYTLFFGADNPLSNWHYASFTVKGVQFNCVEQMMMVCKAHLFNDQQTADRIMAQPHPKEQKALGRQVKNFHEDLWIAKREHFVFVGCLAKFQQNAGMADALLATGETVLVEASPYDRIWGVGLGATDPKILDPSNWQGLNLLGKVLTKVRDALRGVHDNEIANEQCRLELVQRLLAAQAPSLTSLFEARETRDKGAMAMARHAYDETVRRHLVLLGRTAACHEVDPDLWLKFVQSIHSNPGSDTNGHVNPLSRSAVRALVVGR